MEATRRGIIDILSHAMRWRSSVQDFNSGLKEHPGNGLSVFLFGRMNFQTKKHYPQLYVF
jgi:hypothetical protein